MASSFGYASASGHGCRGRRSNIAGGTTNGGRPGEQSWTAPIIADGKLLVRNKAALVCLDLK